MIEVDTPAVVVDADRLQRNLERWQAHCDAVGLANRPHVKKEHAVVALAPEDTLELGQQVRIVPNHVCVVVNLVDELVVHGDGVAPTTWTVDARGRSR